MRRVLLLLLTVLSLPVAAIPLSTVEGQVMSDGYGLPGCTIRLESSTLTRTAVSDAEGRYRFVGVAEGEYEIHFELDGVRPAQQSALVRGELVTIPLQELRPAVIETITISCGSVCGDNPPADRFDRPLCSDYELHTALMESARQGDASSVALLRSRYATADTYSERHRLGGALLGRGNDAEIWNELVSDAEIALRFPHVDGEPSPEFLQHCAERGVDPDGYWQMGEDALEVAGKDPRSLALLRRALAADDDNLVYAGLLGLAAQHDVESLPLIESAIRRFSDYTVLFVDQLALFESERADAVAMKFLEDDADRERYREVRAAAADRQP
jgi:hypothetical protein